MKDSALHPARIRILQGGPDSRLPVVYWISREQRVKDNWALLYAQELALRHKAPLIAVFCLAPSFLGAARRQYDFMLTGLKELEQDLLRLNIPFILLIGKADESLPRWLKENPAGNLVTDFSPLRISREWKQIILKKIKIPFYEVDAHNIIPCWEASNKMEWGAYTLRPKINKKLNEYLEEFPALKSHPHKSPAFPAVDWKKAAASLKVDESVGTVPLPSGEKAANKTLKQFIESRLKDYDESRNDPSLGGQSGLSPYFHFGQLSPHRAALEAKKIPGKSADAFLEELIVRRELADNYCYFNPQYDSFDGFPAWAKETLNAHRKDKRPFLYTREEFESAATHDPAWNAAQRQMVKEGKMHGYMRMYWAKKILEWTKSPEEAIEIAIYLNDRYELDGRDPNGYNGIAWSIGGVHDRPWTERPVFGKIRYMAASGLERKFHIENYIRQEPSLL